MAGVMQDYSNRICYRCIIEHPPDCILGRNLYICAKHIHKTGWKSRAMWGPTSEPWWNVRSNVSKLAPKGWMNLKSGCDTGIEHLGPQGQCGQCATWTTDFVCLVCFLFCDYDGLCVFEYLTYDLCCTRTKLDLQRCLIAMARNAAVSWTRVKSCELFVRFNTQLWFGVSCDQLGG